MDDNSRSPVTLEEVARHAGVSLATASRALNGGNRTVRPELKSRVLASAAVLNYTTNAHAQAVARGRTNVIGLVVHDIADPYFSSIASGVLSSAEEKGLLVTLAITRRDPEREILHVAALRAQRARAVVIAGSRRSDDAVDRRLGRELEAFESGGGRAVLISQPRLRADTIAMENTEGAAALARTLRGLGYTRHAVLAGPRDLLTAVDRVDGYVAGLATADPAAPPPRVIHGDFTRDGGHEAVTSLLPDIGDIDCVFAVNDVMAVGAMAALRANGVRVPADVGVAGFDDIETLRDVAPGLTTVRMPLANIGAQALELVLQERRAQPRQRVVRGDVILRESTPPR